jgi:hypothetical protein
MLRSSTSNETWTPAKPNFNVKSISQPGLRRPYIRSSYTSTTHTQQIFQPAAHPSKAALQSQNSYPDMAVVWDSILESEFPAMTSFGRYDKLTREAVSMPIPVTHQHQHHFHYPNDAYHTLDKLSSHKNSSNTNIALWSPFR